MVIGVPVEVITKTITNDEPDEVITKTFTNEGPVEVLEYEVHEHEETKPVECDIEKPVEKPIAKLITKPVEKLTKKPNKKTEERDPDEPEMDDESIVGHQGERSDPARFIFVFICCYLICNFYIY